MVEHANSDRRSLHQMVVKPQFVNGTIVPEKGELVSNNVPVIEIATYSDTDVFECYVKGFEVNIVMRRMRDDWVNITQIFKVAKFSKAQRTKVLEKESMTMPHEKIQGGYGRFQGTWAPLPSAIILAAKYNIADPVVTQLLQFQFDPNNPPRRRSRNSVLRRSSPGMKITSPSSYNKTPKRKGNSSVRKNTKNKNLIPNPSPLHNVAFETPQQYHRNSVSYSTNNNNNSSITMHHVIGNIPNINGPYNATQKPLQFYPIPTNSRNNVLPHDRRDVNQSFNNCTLNSNSAAHNNFQGGNNMDNGSNFSDINGLQMVNETVDSIRPRERTIKRKSKSKQSCTNVEFYSENKAGEPFDNTVHTMNSALQNNYSAGSNIDVFSTTDNRTPLSSRSNSSQYLPQNQEFNTNDDNTIETLNANEYKEALLQVLATENFDEQTEQLIGKLYYPPPNFDINFIIDGQGHTALHWAAALANLPLVKLLVGINANLTIYNNLGINCITKAVFYNNCYKKQVFPEMIRLLKTCLMNPDANRRLPIHYLVELSVNPSKDQKIIASYIDTILTTLGEESPQLLKSYLDFQDNMGNTALHLAALNLNVTLWNKLSSLGASMDIVNGENETPVSILNKFNFVPPSKHGSQKPEKKEDNSSMIPSTQNSEEKERKQTYMDVNQYDVEDTPASSQVLHNEIRSINKNRVVPDSIQKIKKTRSTTTPVSDKTQTNINSILEDIASLDSLVTSSILKKPPVTVSNNLQQSPVVYRKGLTDLQNSIIVKSPISNPIMSPTNKLENIGVLENTGNLHSRLPENSEMSKSLTKLRNSSTKFASSLTNTINDLTSSIHSTELGITETKQRIRLLQNQKEEVLETLVDTDMNPLNKKSLHEIETKIIDLNEKIDIGKTACLQYSEKSQALKLATLVQDEETSLTPSKSNSKEDTESKETIKESCKLLVELTLLQLKRRSYIDKITNVKVELNSTDKLNKYRYLIGMTIDDIENKLEAIESDLQANP
ncbi:hypothetical protein C6P45_004058 [Maudiozyma exigua]|uniref:HTH APSES-type domain-containing protein n=1 Tax=Maudiozyma exigua TaxID=34358 RepID=A0A9P7BAN3_MAUEX|nr:hypothetical protein C6P45_004058 [Kazachstania exigua]